MEKQIACLIRRKRGNCLWNKLIEIDQKILEKKTYFNWLEEQIDYNEWCLKQKKYSALFKQPLELYDGYNLPALPSMVQLSKVRKICMYQKYDCQDVYNLKKNVLEYHTSRFNQILLEYNQLVVLLLQLKYRAQSNQLKPFLLAYEKVPIPCIGYTVLSDFKSESYFTKKINNITFELIYTDTTLRIYIEKISLYFQKVNDLMSGTYYRASRETLVCLQIQLETRHIDEGLVESIAKSVDQVTRQLRLTSEKTIKECIGNYIELETLDTHHVNKLIEVLTPLGYKAIGKMKNGHFKPQQALVNLKNRAH